MSTKRPHTGRFSGRFSVIARFFDIRCTLPLNPSTVHLVPSHMRTSFPSVFAVSEISSLVILLKYFPFREPPLPQPGPLAALPPAARSESSFRCASLSSWAGSAFAKRTTALTFFPLASPAGQQRLGDRRGEGSSGSSSSVVVVLVVVGLGLGLEAKGCG